MMQPKYIVISTLVASLLVLGGCATQMATNSNAVVDTNTANTNTEVVDNTNETVTNENTNIVDVSGEVDTSDWLTYTNKEYGFGFRYPREWAVVEQKEKIPTNTILRLRINPSNFVQRSPYIDFTNDLLVFDLKYNLYDVSTLGLAHANFTKSKEIRLTYEDKTAIKLEGYLGVIEDNDYAITFIHVPTKNDTVNEIVYEYVLYSGDPLYQEILDQIIRSLIIE